MKSIIQSGKLYPRTTCPFCGAAGKVKTEKNDSGKRLYYVECVQCHARGQSQRLLANVIKHWDNQRYDTRQKHGEWLQKSDYEGYYIECSECGVQYGYIKEEDPPYSKYCSECGARLIVTQQIGESKISFYDQVEAAERIKEKKKLKDRENEVETYRRKELAETFLRKIIGVEEDDKEDEADENGQPVH